eukprot:scaffold91036_cov27-Tisochrysis_lutea.AAC.4
MGEEGSRGVSTRRRSSLWIGWIEILHLLHQDTAFFDPRSLAQHRLLDALRLLPPARCHCGFACLAARVGRPQNQSPRPRMRIDVPPPQRRELRGILSRRDGLGRCRRHRAREFFGKFVVAALGIRVLIASGVASVSVHSRRRGVR